MQTSVIMTKNEHDTVLAALTILLINMLIFSHIRMSSKHQTLANPRKLAFYIMLFLAQVVAYLILDL